MHLTELKQKPISDLLEIAHELAEELVLVRHPVLALPDGHAHRLLVVARGREDLRLRTRRTGTGRAWAELDVGVEVVAVRR